MGKDEEQPSTPQTSTRINAPSVSPPNPPRQASSPPYAHYPPRIVFDDEDDEPTTATQHQPKQTETAMTMSRPRVERENLKTRPKDLIREPANDIMQTMRKSARLEELSQRRQQATTPTQPESLLHFTRSTARPRNENNPFMEAPAKTMSTASNNCGVTT
ncbi:unnamed protein product [Aphanomyces euteiches]